MFNFTFQGSSTSSRNIFIQSQTLDARESELGTWVFSYVIQFPCISTTLYNSPHPVSWGPFPVCLETKKISWFSVFIDPFFFSISLFVLFLWFSLNDDGLCIFTSCILYFSACELFLHNFTCIHVSSYHPMTNMHCFFLVLAKMECFALLCFIICTCTHLTLCCKDKKNSTFSVISPLYFLSKYIFSIWLNNYPSILPTKTLISSGKSLCFTW